MNDTEWFAEHTAYLATPEWAFRRGQVLNRDGYRCQARLAACRGDASQVHHLSYRHWRNEPIFDLTSVCAACHTEITEMDRANRPPEARLIREDEAAKSLGTRIEELLETSAPSTAVDIALFVGGGSYSVEKVIKSIKSSRRIIVKGEERGAHLYGLREVGIDIPNGRTD